MEIQKQIDYWHNGSQSDIETAGILIEKKKYREGMFFCHLAMEKMLKALYVKKTSELAPKSHNLFMLAEKSGITLNDDNEYLFGLLMEYNIQGRYPGPSVAEHTGEQVSRFMKKTMEVLKWAEKML